MLATTAMTKQSSQKTRRRLIDPEKNFADFIREKGLKNTAQRNTIVNVFFSSDKHLTTEELYHKVREKDSSIGQATVYRTLKLLCSARLASEMYFGDGTIRYEPIIDDTHHDHLICNTCGKNIEVVDEQIENLQEKLAAKHGFSLVSHRMYLYGICSGCRK